MNKQDILALLDLPPVQFEAWYESRPDAESAAAEDTLLAVAQRAALLAKYLDLRSIGYDHASAADGANHALVGTRKALGFADPASGAVGF